jgi:hypothetical protein
MPQKWLVPYVYGPLLHLQQNNAQRSVPKHKLFKLLPPNTYPLHFQKAYLDQAYFDHFLMDLSDFCNIGYAGWIQQHYFQLQRQQKDFCNFVFL